MPATPRRRWRAANSRACSSRPCRGSAATPYLLTRNRAEADDLVQDAVVLALRNRDAFEPGTNFCAWSYSIVRNRFLSTVRQRRRREDLDMEAAEAGHTGPPHDDRLVLKEVAWLFGRLPDALREALVLVAVEGRSYDEVAASQGCAVGTAKSRVFRARYLLRFWLLGGSSASNPVKNADARTAAMTRAVVS
jgi:RNA polymerase sigma-70 factor (ECF subfamily)